MSLAASENSRTSAAKSLARRRRCRIVAELALLRDLVGVAFSGSASKICAALYSVAAPFFWRCSVSQLDVGVDDADAALHLARSRTRSSSIWSRSVSRKRT